MILDKLVEATKERVEREKKEISLSEMKELALQCERPLYSFKEALSKRGLSYILEVKKASPSKGLIDPTFDYLNIAKDYEEIGADAISVLTETDYFKGDIKYLSEIAETVKIPVLRKDFVIDEYMIYQARVNGASAVLLITGILDDDTLKKYIELVHSLKMDALVEARDELQVERALNAGADIIGVNNRDLRDFSVDIHHSIKFRKQVPESVLFVSESGIYERAQTKELEDEHVNAVLIGETLMRASNKKEMLEELKGVH